MIKELAPVELENVTGWNTISSGRTYRKPIEKAETVAEFKEKYSRRRFNSSTAGKQIIINYIYQCYQINEGTAVADLKPLYKQTNEEIIQKIDPENVSDIQHYNAIVKLIDWARVAMKFSERFLNLFNTNLLNYRTTLDGIIEFNKKMAVETGGDIFTDHNKLSYWIHTQYNPDATPINWSEFPSRFISQYNMFISIIAEEIDVPEFNYFALPVENTQKLIEEVNELVKERIETARKAGYKNVYRDTSDSLFIDPIKTEWAEDEKKDVRLLVRDYYNLPGGYDWGTIFEGWCIGNG